MQSISALYKLFKNSKGICTDTRSLQPGMLFFALKGNAFNGNKFAAQALRDGALAAVVDEHASVNLENTFLVDNVLLCLQQLANYHRKQLHIPVIGITGSNGKTTTKELIATVLNQSYRVFATKGNLNNHIGVPLTLLSIPDKTEIAIIEMGANHIGEIESLCKIAEPHYGLITNIGTAHIEGFGSYQGVKQAKGELYQYVKSVKGALFVNDTDTELASMCRQYEKIIHYGSGPQASVKGQVAANNPYLSLTGTVEKKVFKITTQLIGHYNLSNLLAALCIGHYFQVPLDHMAQAIQCYSPDNNRSQYIDSGRNKMVMDAYNANPSSMEAAIRNFMQLELPNKVLILGDMLELGNQSKAQHTRIVDLIGQHPFDQVLLIGPEFSSVGHAYNGFNDVIAAKTWLEANPILHATVLLKGSRGIKLEQLQDIL